MKTRSNPMNFFFLIFLQYTEMRMKNSRNNNFENNKLICRYISLRFHTFITINLLINEVK